MSISTCLSATALSSPPTRTTAKYLFCTGGARGVLGIGPGHPLLQRRVWCLVLRPEDRAPPRGRENGCHSGISSPACLRCVPDHPRFILPTRARTREIPFAREQEGGPSHLLEDYGQRAHWACWPERRPPRDVKGRGSKGGGDIEATAGARVE